MPRSLYKARGMGKLPPCAICMGPGAGGRAELHLPFGLKVWLCAEHRRPEFLTSRAGRDLVVSLMGVWRAAGCMTSTRGRALDSHLARLRSAPARAPRPGSYSWPVLRQEAEARFAGGEPPARVIADLRARHARDTANAPSRRTMQRWFAEGRWLSGGPTPGRPDAPRPSHGPVRPEAPDPTVVERTESSTETRGGRMLATTGWRRTDGFTFVEVLVTTIVLALLAALVIPSLLATRTQAEDATAVALLRMGASAVETAAVGTEGYAALTPAALEAVEGTVTWLAAAGAIAEADEISVTGIGDRGYTLSTASTSGVVYVLEKDVTATPTVTRRCGPGCSW